MDHHPDGTTCTTISTCREPARRRIAASGPLRAAPRIDLPAITLYACEGHAQAARSIVRGRTTITDDDATTPAEEFDPYPQLALFDPPRED